MVNSIHHQCVDSLGAHFKVSAQSDDGVVEAIEMDSRDHPFALGVQSHAEVFRAEGHERWLGVFKALVQASEKMKK